MKKIVYISNSDSENIEVWNLCNSGNMDLIQKVETYSSVQPINIIKNKNLLYAGTAKKNNIITYNIDDKGCLKKKKNSSFPGKANYLSFDQNKKFLFCSSYHSNALFISKLDIDGIPNYPIQIIYNVYGCHAAKIHHKYNLLCITSLKEDCIHLYYLTQFGILKNTEQQIVYTQKGSGPRHIVFHPNQDFIYTINEFNGTIDVWEIFNNKNIIHIKNIQNININNKPVLKNYWSSDIHITSCGRFLYAADRFSSIISLFYIESNSKKIVFFKSYKTETQPRSFCIDPENKYLIVAGEKSNTLGVYKISYSTGELKKVNVYKTGKRPIWVCMHQLGCNKILDK